MPGIFEITARGFGEEYGERQVCDPKPHLVEDWLAEQDRGNATSKARAGTLILAAVSWARK